MHSQLSKYEKAATTETVPGHRAPRFYRHEHTWTLSRTSSASQYLVVMKDKYFKITQAVFPPKVSEEHVASIFFNKWIIPYRFLARLLAHELTLLVSRFFESILLLPWTEASYTKCWSPTDEWSCQMIPPNIDCATALLRGWPPGELRHCSAATYLPENT